MVQVNPTKLFLRFKFRKGGSLQYVSHLDLVRTMHKVIVRAKLPLWYTEGFNPKPKMIFAAPLSIGTESLCEFMDIRMNEQIDPAEAMAAGAMGVLNDNGIDVPGEISLIGFDDVLVSRYVRPRLTTVRYPIVTMATQAAELALALADNRPLPEITNVFSPTLVRRHSVSTPSLEASHHATSD